jgi:hypothetical protein
MPGVDLVDAFAELVVCVVFNLPRDEPRPPLSRSSSSSSSRSSDDRDGGPAGANSSGTTQIFPCVNSLEERDGPRLPASPHTHDVDASTATSAASFAGAGQPLSQVSSAQSFDHYPGGIWNPVPAFMPPHTAASGSTSMVSSSGSGGQNQHQHHQHHQRPPTSPHPSGAVSLNTGDVSTPRSSGPSTDRSVGFWSRVLGSSGVLQTPPRSSSYGQLPNTGVTTNASSYVQLTEDDLGMLNASGQVIGGNSSSSNNNNNTATPGWTDFLTPPSLAQYSTSQQVEWGGETRGVPALSRLSTPLYEASPSASATQLPPLPSSYAQQHRQGVRLNPHGLYAAARQSNSPQEGQSQASSTSEFVVL